MKLSLLIPAGLGICLMSSAALAAGGDDQTTAAASTVTKVCQNCHGPNGNSTSATFPRLNGQQPDYIAAQLKPAHERRGAELPRDIHSLMAAHHQSRDRVRALVAQRGVVG